MPELMPFLIYMFVLFPVDHGYMVKAYDSLYACQQAAHAFAEANGLWWEIDCGPISHIRGWRSL